MPVASLPAKFRMPDIERYTGIGCPRLHLRLYSTVMRAHGLDEPQMITLFPLSLSGAAQRWFASLESSRHVSRRELEALRQRIEESVSSFISRWRGKIAEIVDRPSERDQIQMVLKSLQPGSPDMWSGSRSQILGPRPTEVGAISSSSQRPLRHHQPIPQFSEPHSSYASHQYRPRAPRPTYDQTHMPQTLVLPSYATQGIKRPAVSYTATGQPCYAAQFTARPCGALSPTWSPATSAPFALRTQRQFSQIGMPLSQALRKLTEAGLLTALTPRPLPQPIPAQVLVHLGQPSVTTNPLPTHTTHAVPPPAGGIHFLDFDETDDHVHMLSWDDSDPEPIMPAGIYETSGVTLEPQIPAPFRLVPEAASVQAATSEPLTFTRYSVQAPYILIPDVEEPFSVLQYSSDALTRALSQIRVDTTTTPEGLIHMMTAGRATCIVFSDDDLPPEGSDHTRPLYISVGCSGRRVPSVLLDNGSALNVCPLATAIALGYAPSDFGPTTQTVRAYDSTRREVMGTLEIELLIGPATFVAVFQVVVVQSVGDMFIAAEPVLEISHTDDDLFLTGFTFDEVQTVEIEDFCRDFVAMSFDRMGAQWCSILCGACPIYPAWGWVDVSMDRARESEGSTDPHTFLLSSSPIHQELSRLLCEGIRAIDPCGRSEDLAPQEAELQRLVQQLRLRDGAPGPSTSVLIAPSSPDRTSLMTLCFPDETMSMGPLLSHVGIVEGASDFVDPPLSFDVLSGFVSRSDIVSDVSSMDLSIFEYLPVSCDIDLSAPSSPTSQIFDIDDEIAQHDSDDDSSSVSDSDPVDQRVSPAVGDTEIVDFGTADQPRELRIGSDLSTDERTASSSCSEHIWTSLHEVETIAPSLELAGERGDSEATQCGFLSVVEYPEWLANVVPVPKKDGKVRVCVDFRDLNKASPKDDFPLPHIDMLVDSTAGHSMLSFMDGFSGYSQILMAPEDMEKTSFITEWGTYCYRVMPFGLKNAGATYQRAATTLFHDMMHRDVEVYVDDMIVKSRGRSDHLAALERFFERIRQFRLRLNPKKCTFGVTSGKLLGYMSIDRHCEPIFRLLRKSQPTVWDDQCQRAFERIRVLVVASSFGSAYTRPSSTPIPISFGRGFGCMLAQLDDSGKDRAIYYLSKRMLDYETRYVTIERYCLALVWATRRLRHYMTEYSVHLISRLDPLRYLFDRPALVGRLMRWLVLLTEFDIHYVTQKSIRGSIVADHLASLPVSDARAIDDDFPDEDVAAVTSLSGWRMYFDGAANHSGYGIGVLLISPHETALELGIRQMEVFGDSNLVLRQIQGEWKTRDVKLRPYHAYLELLVARFEDLRYTHLPRAQNQFADALATLASMIDIPADATVRPLLIESRSAPAYCCLIDDIEKMVCPDRLCRSSDERGSCGSCGPHMGGHMLARKIMRTGYFWLTMETDCCQFVQRCPECQIHGDLIHVPPSSCMH
ncbi:Transposon Ty3-I Gag-Pol polyprotein [Vitis vinifera]|uniref:Transposon Ty3-I Gag-Pol polyprotein n=1 Tax=Vitis vinifera TaxID=29760 RepID=A0A438FUZ3_VITVI|nr:Transposon Ty3-I Gag-Pol polyprotein [Vitis vinifera]